MSVCGLLTQRRIRRRLGLAACARCLAALGEQAHDHLMTPLVGRLGRRERLEVKQCKVMISVGEARVGAFEAPLAHQSLYLIAYRSAPILVNVARQQTAVCQPDRSFILSERLAAAGD